jgi:hypothetical protein
MRKLLVAVCVLALLPFVASAQPTPVPELEDRENMSVRVWSMALEQDDTADVGNIMTFPQEVVNYGNRVWIGDSDFDTGESEPNEVVDHGLLLINVSSYTVGLGVWSGQYETDFVIPITDPTWDSLTNYWVEPDLKTDIFFGGALGNGNIGANLVYATASDTQTDEYQDLLTPASVTDELNTSASLMGIRVGYGVKEVGPFASVDAAVGIMIPGLEITLDEPYWSDYAGDGVPRTQSIEKDGGNLMDVDLMAVKELDDDTNVRILVSYDKKGFDTLCVNQYDEDEDGIYQTDDSLDVDAKSTQMNSVSMISLRGALNKVVNDDELLVVVLGIEMGSAEVEEDYQVYNNSTNTAVTGEQGFQRQDSWLLEQSTFAVPFAVAVEGNVLRDNITARLGVRKNLLSSITETFTYNDYEVDSDVWQTVFTYTGEEVAKLNEDATLGLGVGVELGNFIVDGYMEQDILFNGPYWVTGESSSFISKLELTYAWE